MLKSLIVATATLLIGACVALAGPLQDAVKNDDLARLQELVEAGEDLNAEDIFGTALHLAALNNNVDAARLLIDAGTDVNLPQRGGGQQTALYIAAQRGSVEVVTILIEAGADVEARSEYGFTPLHGAASADQVDVVKLLIEAGADLEAPGYYLGRTPLMNAVDGNAVGVIELFVTEGADLDAKRPNGVTALHHAAGYGSPDAARKLIELGADVNGLPETEPVAAYTPLALAIINDWDKVADILREAGASE
jgi:ankyrin repeat protein